MTSLFIILLMFIHNSSSKNGRKTTASKLLTHPSLQRLLCRQIFALLTSSCIFPEKFPFEASKFLFKISVTCYSKINTVNFSHFYFTFIAKIVTQLSLSQFFNYQFLVSAIVFPQSIYPYPNIKRQMPFRITTKMFSNLP